MAREKRGTNSVEKKRRNEVGCLPPKQGQVNVWCARECPLFAVVLEKTVDDSTNRSCTTAHSAQLADRTGLVIKPRHFTHPCIQSRPHPSKRNKHNGNAAQGIRCGGGGCRHHGPEYRLSGQEQRKKRGFGQRKKTKGSVCVFVCWFVFMVRVRACVFSVRAFNVLPPFQWLLISFFLSHPLSFFLWTCSWHGGTGI